MMSQAKYQNVRDWKKVLCCLLLILFFTQQTLFASPISRQKLVKGKATSIETDYNIGDVAVSNQKVCDFMITDSRREIYLNPLTEGAITLTIWDSDGKKREVVPVEVYNSDLEDMADEAKALFADTNVDVRTEGRRVVLAGDATSKAVLEQASSLASRYPEIENNVQMSREVLQTVAERVEAAIATPGIKVRNVRGRLVLEGVAYSAASAKRAVGIASIYDPNILDLMEVKETGRRPGQDKLIKLDVYFMEVKKEALRSFGINWAPGSVPKGSESEGGAGGGLLGGVTNFGTSLIGFVFNLVPKIKFLREKGYARVLDNATLVVKSGEVGDFFNGTQVPYYSDNDVTFKDVGVKLHAEPIATAGAVDLNINATLNSLAANIEAGIDTRTVSTSAYVPVGQSIILANMISNRDVKTYNKKPSDLDSSSALFNLALSKDFQSGRSEFVVFVEPTIVEGTLPAEQKLSEYLTMEHQMIRERSKKEYKDFLEKNGGLVEIVKKTGRKRKW